VAAGGWGLLPATALGAQTGRDVALRKLNLDLLSLRWVPRQANLTDLETMGRQSRAELRDEIESQRAGQAVIIKRLADDLARMYHEAALP